ncbi:MAG: serine hydrolase domain-containing protein [Bacteroidia bacterium]|nr:serine hydrolase domain-containing protein [Bacteroidia bacterium]
MNQRGLIILALALVPFSLGLILIKPNLAEHARTSLLPMMDKTPLPDLLSVEVQSIAQKSVKLEGHNEQWDQVFRKYQKTHDFNGNVLIANQGKIVHVGSYGFANHRNKDSLHLGSVFQLASVSKTITAAAVMMLYEEKLLDFDTPVKKFFPQWPYKEMTVRHLLNHRSGLQRYDALSINYWDRNKFMNYEDVLQMYVDTKPGLFFDPGSKFDYSNSNYAILAALVSDIARQPFEEFVQERIFDRLGMQDSYFANHLERLKKENHTVGYKYMRGKYRNAGGDHVDGVMGDKGLHATIRDLYLFDQALYGNALLKQTTLSEAFTPASRKEGYNNYGFGFRLKSHILGLAYHFGWWRGYRTCFIRDIQAEQTIIILSNHDHPGKIINYWEIYKKMNKLSVES